MAYTIGHFNMNIPKAGIILSVTEGAKVLTSYRMLKLIRSDSQEIKRSRITYKRFTIWGLPSSACYTNVVAYGLYRHIFITRTFYPTGNVVIQSSFKL